MLNEKRTVDHILAEYTAHVREAATRALLAVGYLGIDPRPDNDGPTTLEQVRAAFKREGTKFPVNTLGSDKTVFTDPTVNLLFRAWHDIGHAMLGAEFNAAGELEVAQWQASYLNGIDKQIIMSDIVDQYAYYQETGEYPDDQRAFVIDKVFGKRGRLPPHSPRYAVVSNKDRYVVFPQHEAVTA